MNERHSGHEGGDKKVHVAIATTAGFFPAEGFNEVPETQKVQVELVKAANKLNITNPTGWIATVVDGSGKRTISTDSTYAENHLVGEVTIDWGPSEGGGGASPGR